MSEPSDINQTVKESEYAATSATGNAAIYIYNYYGYREEVRVAPVKSVETATDDKLPSPYRGLFHFGPEDAELFFGREVFVAELVQATQTHNFIPVLGASGSGKSSVVFAGLIPKLQQLGHWQFTHFRPGAIRTKEGHSTVDPFYALATALVPLYEPKLNTTDQLAQASKLAEYLRNGEVLLGDMITKFQQNYPQHRLLVIADQFEELYTLCQDETLRRHFLDILLDSIHSPLAPAKSPLVLVMTMRVDFLGNALSYPAFADVMRQRQIQIRSMNRKELLQVIEKPAQKRGVMFETGLAERILDEVEDKPGSLPLLEFALTSLWLERRGNQLTHKAYEEIGEVKGALTKYAEQKYSDLDPNQQEQARRIFVQLVRPGEGTEDTRRLATKAELGEARWSLVKQLADERLVVTSRNAAEQETVEVVHEALIRNWQQLRQWMKESRSFRVWQERLRVAMKQWEGSSAKKDKDALLRGATLEEAKQWIRDHPDDISQKAKNFIQESQKQQEYQKRRLIFFVILFLLLIFVTVGNLLWSQEQQTRTVLARSLINQAELTRKPDNNLQLSVALAIEAIKQSPSEAAEELMYNALPLLPRSKPPITKHKSGVNVIAFSPKGTYLVTAGFKSIAKPEGNPDLPVNTCLWETTSDKPLNGKSDNCVEHKDNVNAVAFSPDEKYLATASLDGKACVWETISIKKIACIDPPNENGIKVGANAVSFSPDGKYLAIAKADGKVFVLETNGYNSINSMKHEGSVLAMTFSVDGQYLVTASLDGTAYLWRDWKSPNSGMKPVKRTHSTAVTDVAFSPDSKYLATTSGRTAQVWKINSDNSVELFKVLKKHDRGILAVTFSQDGQYLATASLDGIAYLWRDWKNPSNKNLVVPLRHGGPVTDVAFSPDSKYLATASSDNSARVWDATNGNEFTRLIHRDEVNAIAFSPDKKFLLVTASLDGTARVWELNSDRTVALMRHNAKVNAMALSYDGRHIATASNDKTVRIWSATSGYQELVLRPLEGAVMAVTFSQNGEYLAAVSSNNKGKNVTVWNVVSGRKIWQSPPEQNIDSVAFSPDGKYLATTSSYIAELWSILTGNKLHIRTMEHKQYIISVVFSQDSKYLVTASRDNTACVWDVSTGQKVMPSCLEHSAFVEAVAFSQDKDRKLLATASRDGKVKVSQIPGKELNELSLYWPVTSVVFSPNSQYLVTVSNDNIVRVWEATKKNEKPTATIKHVAPVTAVSFSPDGKYLATASKDSTVRVWETTSDKKPPVETIKHEEPVTAVAFSSDGKNQYLRLATTSGKIVRVLPFWRQEQELIRDACAHLTENLTQKEWNQYVGDEETYQPTCRSLQ